MASPNDYSGSPVQPQASYKNPAYRSSSDNSLMTTTGNSEASLLDDSNCTELSEVHLHKAPTQALHMNGHGLRSASPERVNGGVQASVYSVPESDVSYKSGLGLLANRSSLEKCLLLFSLLSVILVCVLMAALVNSTNRHLKLLTDENRANDAMCLQGTSSTPICTTQGCVNAAAYLLASIDNSADPCENFYQFACGKWNTDNPIPDDKSRYGTFSMVRDRLSIQMKVLLENEAMLNPNNTAVILSRHVYKSCMNLPELKKQNSSGVWTALDGFGGWPLLNTSWSSDGFQLTNVLAIMKRDYTADPLFTSYVYADAKNTSRNVLHIDQPGLSLIAREYYLNDTIYGGLLKAYRDFIRDTALLMGRDRGFKFNRSLVKPIEKQIDDVLELEKVIANLTTAQDERRNATALYHKWTVASLKEKVKGIDWSEFFNIILPESVKPTISDDTTVIIMEPTYLVEVMNVIRNTNESTIVNYLMWRLVKLMHRIMDDRYQDIAQTFMQIMTGRAQKSARWKECVQSTVNALDMATGAMYVERHFKSNDKQEALAMIEKLVVAFKEIISELPWMDDRTKEVAVGKTNTIIAHIGYPEFVKNITEIAEFYDGLSLAPQESYLDIITKISVWHQNKSFLDLLKPFDKNNFDISPAIVNAFYSPEKNAIMFPAGILQPPFFRGDYPKAVNYGAMGTVIGHELTHGFDDQGSQYDASGNLQNWWSMHASNGFRDRTRCIVDQYSSYKVEDINMHINGRLTQGENIADNGGVKEAFRAYRKYVNSLGSEEPLLPGMNMTNDQVFFLSFASFWCGNRKPQAGIQQILTDSHSPEMFRVIGVMSNLDDFAKAYNCQRGSRMNPPKSTNTKCEVW